ncbi:MAG: hypothetical protein K5829_05875 [Treponema sp.]|nr:hypothetical protein [Treponema sp.]
MPQIVEMTCPGCGARVQIDQKTCEWCHAPIVITSMSDIFSMSMPDINKYSKSYEKDLSENPDSALINNSAAMCYLTLGLYDKALEKFDKAIEQDINNWETYLYAAVCLLKGNKAFVTSRADIDKIEQYIKAALMIQENGLLRYFQAYIKYDFFKRKFLKTSPTWEEAFYKAKEDKFSSADVERLFTILKQEKPNWM